jgi:hypothetical protein
MRARLNDEDGGIQPWAHVSVRHSARRQATLQNRAGVRRRRSVGLLLIQLFTPGGTGLRECDPLADALLLSIDGERTTNGVAITNARLGETGTSGAWFMSNVIADFTYDTIR